MHRAAQRYSSSPRYTAFSLVELSIVLVILGLLVGGVMSGLSLIRGATIRAQINQITQYQTAVNTFRLKHGGLPGDLALTTAQSFGYYTTGYSGGSGLRDGNGIIERGSGGGNQQYYIIDREFQLFWFDLSQSGLIANALPNSGATPTSGGATPNLANYAAVATYLPTAAIGNQSFVYVTYANPTLINQASNAVITSGLNYFTISAVYSSTSGACVSSNPGLSVAQAYNIDMKIDDGSPSTGNSIAQYAGCNTAYPTGDGNPDTSSTCWNHTTGRYSIGQNNGEGINCGLSIKMTP